MKVYTKKQKRCRRSHRERMSNKRMLLSKNYGLATTNSMLKDIKRKGSLLDLLAQMLGGK